MWEALGRSLCALRDAGTAWYALGRSLCALRDAGTVWDALGRSLRALRDAGTGWDGLRRCLCSLRDALASSAALRDLLGRAGRSHGYAMGRSATLWDTVRLQNAPVNRKMKIGTVL